MMNMANDSHPIGLRIKRARERMRITQRQLADNIGVSQKTIDNWENGRSYPRSAIGALESVLGSIHEEQAARAEAGPAGYPDFVGGDEGFQRIWDIPDEFMSADEREYAILRVALRRAQRIEREAVRRLHGTSVHHARGSVSPESQLLGDQ